MKTFKATQDKVTRALPVSSQAEAGNIKILQAPWNEDFLREVENFPEGGHDDIVDALSGAFLMLTRCMTYDLTALTTSLGWSSSILFRTSHELHRRQ